jgi:hypothetical protein
VPAGAKRAGAAARVAEAKKMMREADENGDGRISRAEFFSLLSAAAMGMHDSLSMYDDRVLHVDAAAPPPVPAGVGAKGGPPPAAARRTGK